MNVCVAILSKTRAKCITSVQSWGVIDGRGQPHWEEDGAGSGTTVDSQMRFSIKTEITPPTYGTHSRIVRYSVLTLSQRSHSIDSNERRGTLVLRPSPQLAVGKGQRIRPHVPGRRDLQRARLVLRVDQLNVVANVMAGL